MRKCFLFILLFILVSCAEIIRGPAASFSQTQHIVFDIDWTIVAEVKDKEALKKFSDVIHVDGTDYVLYPGLRSLIKEMVQHPEIKISFFSGGANKRNEKLLSLIKLDDGRTLKSIAHKILGREDLVRMENVPESARFAERFKKDLSKISEDLDNVIMFDDTANFTLPNLARQQDQVFFMGTSYLPFASFDEARKHAGDYIPKTYEAWKLDRERLELLKEAFKESYQEWTTSGSNNKLIDFLKSKETLLRFDSHQWTEYSKQLFQRSCFHTMRDFL